MTSLPPVPNHLKVILHWIYGTSSTAQTALHFKYSGGPPTAADCTSLASSIILAEHANLVPLASTELGFNGVTVQDLSSTSAFEGFAPDSSSGSRGSGALPAGACVLINKKVARHYRGGKPRSYFPFGTAGDLTGPRGWQGASITAFENGYAAFITAVNGLTSGSTVIQEERNVSYFSGYTLGPAMPGGFRKKIPQLRSGGPLTEDITASSCNPAVGSQRRRNSA